MKYLKINDFTEPELELFRNMCNFDIEQLQYFNLRAKNKSNVEISMEMNISESKVSALARKVKSKILKVI